MERLASKTVLITGAAGAIGREMVAVFAAEGAHVAASDLAAPTLEAAALSLAQDVTKSDADRALYNNEFVELGAFISNSATKAGASSAAPCSGWRA